MPGLSPETVVARRDEPLTARVDDDLVMLEPQQSRYFGLDPIGRRVWELLDEPRSVDVLCTALEGEYDVPPEQCRADVVAFLEQMADAELIEIRSGD